MVAAVRQQDASLSIIEDLFAQCYVYEFHQSIKLLELSFKEAIPLGTGSIPEYEVVSLSSRVAYSYPPSDLFSLKLAEVSSNRPYPCFLKVNFLGIAGPNGPLPMPFSEQLMERARLGDTGFRDFLDIFNHRLLSLLHRIRRKYWIGLDQRDPDKTDFAQIIFSFLGLGLDSLRNRLSVPDRGLLYYAGLLWKSPRSAKGLEVFLSHYFNVPVKVKQFEGQWCPIEKDHQTCIGRHGRYHTLGVDASVGDKFWNTQGKIILQVGPLSWHDFQSFLPSGKAYKSLCALARFYLGIEHTFAVNLVIKAKDVQKSSFKNRTLLGWSSWMKTKPFKQDDNQVELMVIEE